MFAALLKPQHVDQTDGVGTFGRRDRIGQALEASLAQRRAPERAAAIVRGNPHVIAKRQSQISKPRLDLAMRALAFPLRHGRLAERARFLAGGLKPFSPSRKRRPALI